MHAQPRLALSVRQTRAGSADRKSTRLNSSHMSISYAVFCLKKDIGVAVAVDVARADDLPAGARVGAHTAVRVLQHDVSLAISIEIACRLDLPIFFLIGGHPPEFNLLPPQLPFPD